MYTGRDKDRFGQLKDMFSDLSWDESQVDAELAFGAHVAPPSHLRLIADAAGGGLGFSENGRSDPPGPSLLIMPIPIPLAKHAAMMQPDKCASLFASSFRAGSYAGPFDVTENGIKACDAWGDPDQFRASLMHMSMTRAAQPSSATKAP
jgi:hypothetical protein